MIRDGSEKRLYRKSPGRQYGYEYDPLNSQRLNGASIQSKPLSTRENSGDIVGRHTSGLLGPRPDPRRTRQLVRQNIIASKSKSAVLDDTGHLDSDLHDQYASPDEDLEVYENQSNTTRYPYPPPRSVHLRPSVQEQYSEIDEGYEDELFAHNRLDPDLEYDDYGEEDYLAPRLTYTETPHVRSGGSRMPPDTSEYGRRRSAPLDYEEDELEEVPVRSKKKKKGMTRRKLLFATVVAGGTAIAGYELLPKLPHALEQAGTNIEHQLQDAFNKGVAAGEEAVRKEFINALDSMEGVSLEAAIAAARLTRVAYDVFVSPLVTLAATVADDFLSITLAALTKARSWLQQINADNATLAALQSVLQSWVKQINTMPKKLQTITETDLDGAQAYLRALQRKIQEEQAKLNGQSTPSTSAPTSTPPPTSTPTH